MRLGVVKDERLGEVDVVYHSVQSSEDHRGLVHIRHHSGAAHRERLEGDVHRRGAALKIEGTVDPLGVALHVDIRQLIQLAVYKKAVFIAEAVIAHAARKTQRDPFAAQNAVGAEALVIVVARL